MSYAPHATLVAPARPRASLWRLALGILMTLLVVLAGGNALFALAAILHPEDGARLARMMVQAEAPATLLALLFAMGLLGLGTWAAARLLHGRSLRSLVGPPDAALSQGLRVLAAATILNGLLIGAALVGTPEPLRPNLAAGQWLVLLPLSLLAIFVQVGSEELFFRGYLQSQLAARFRSPLLWLVLPSALFALGHYAGGFGTNAWLVAAWAGAFGLIAADLTARSGTLGPALALHFVNNAVVLLGISLQGPMSGLALYTYPFGPGDADEVGRVLPADFAALGASWIAARLALGIRRP
ncbi:CPBP family intramembrane glutamic endopeptidase [Roseivivax isoporae]|uniref:CAAX prenyl protease 2/Lysostaphin resistance protein A-like domain-containing protein n=1 Tax=Roseivivax isoporae LMG 25204 TaxID=1449351 RepID=X7F723_9RHOB|nr:type II CAAX endopeptidase family protein [Roseivivax isoporae]ETX27884.1 hypothetical protein RISW2_10470 [Roseivivax isoporae LMG 25204]